MTTVTTREFVAPARIHCGLISVAPGASTRFGGCGVMIDRPATRIRLTTANQWSLRAAAPAWWLKLIQQWQSSFAAFGDTAWQQPISTWPLEFEVLEAPARHVGLGSGTQAAMLVATALCQWTGLPQPGPGEMALAMGRGKRSAIGTFGFLHGGFLIDRGISGNQPLAQLDYQSALPTNWRVVVIQPQVAPGISGQTELVAFERQISGDLGLAQEMQTLLQRDLVPALAVGDFLQFAQAIHQFNYFSGLNYAQVQSGAYHSPAVTEIVRQIQRWGYAGIVQSSWGPTLAVFTPDEPTALTLVQQLQSHQGWDVECQIANIAGPRQRECIQTIELSKGHS